MSKKYGPWLLVFFLAACGTSGTQTSANLPPSEPPPALPTVEPLVIEPTNTPLPMSLNSFLREEFTVSPLDNDWNWYGVIPGDIVLSEGWLMLETSNFDMLGLGGNTPVLTHPLFPGDLILQAHIHFEPQRDYQSAGIAFFADYDHFISLTRGFCIQSPNCSGDGIYLEDDQRFILGESFNNNLGNLPEGTLYLRLIKVGNTYTGYYSTDGITWIEVASTTAEYEPTYIAVFAAANQAGFPSQRSFFDFVEVLPYSP